MHTEHEPGKPAAHPDIRYEKTDAQVRPLYQFLVWISVLTLITAVLVAFIQKGVNSWLDARSARPVMAPAPDAQPPAPRLQLREPIDLAAFRKEEAEILENYGIVDREQGIYRIPIEEAMKLTVERGVPTPAPTPAKPAAAAPAAPARNGKASK